MEREINILSIFEKLSSDDVKYFLIDLSVFPEETGGEVADVLAISSSRDLESLQRAFKELQTFGLVGITRNDTESKEIEFRSKDKIWLKKGITGLIKQYITGE